MVNVIPLENISSLMNYLGLSYPTHFLKIAGSGIGDNFLEHSLKNKPIYLRDELLFKHCSLQIKQNVYSIGTYSAHIFHIFIHQNFPDKKTSVVRAMIVEYISQKRGWH